ncbi:hypothetical protein HYALB_00011918 [Hymenoscyphus albidus]|uniref:MADS-box domain-containing protein n=1 Tax=Hymenoscyphus albidus TaxID=595503 RepID=A0A9N9LQQ3_9HELO|nr:hypothetical protein HYALB_00011918 [Hymenoscyphus albidus]
MNVKASNFGKRRSERIRRKKKTLFHKAFLLGKEDGIEIAMIVLQQGRYSTYSSITRHVANSKEAVSAGLR